MAKHTPGDWFVDTDESDFTVSSDHGQQVCRALSADDFPCLEEGTEDHMDDEARANARLIAAAPDLLAALLELRDNGPSRFAWDRANEAIEKAQRP